MGDIIILILMIILAVSKTIEAVLSKSRYQITGINNERVRKNAKKISQARGPNEKTVDCQYTV